MKKITHGSKVKIKSGDMAGTEGIVTLVAVINGIKRYYVQRENLTVKWYTFYQLRLV